MTARANRTTPRPANSRLRPSEDKGLTEEDPIVAAPKDEGDEDEEDEEESAPPADDVDDEGDEDGPTRKAMNESEREIDRANQIAKEAYRRGVRARDKAIARMKGSGTGAISTVEADRIGKEAYDAVLAEAMVGRDPGWYVTSPFEALDEDGNRRSYANLARVPDVVVARLRKSGDIKMLKAQGCIRELKKFAFE